MSVAASAQRARAPVGPSGCSAAALRSRAARCSRARAARPCTAAALNACHARLAAEQPASGAPAWRSAALAALASLALAAAPPAALAAAFSGVIELSDISYEVEACPQVRGRFTTCQHSLRRGCVSALLSTRLM